MKSPTLTLIAAAGENNALGKEGDLPWHLPDDFKRFKKLTIGHPIVMGRKTFETFPKPLPDRTHVVITRKKDYPAKNCVVTHSIEDALFYAKENEETFVIGGGEIYAQAMPYADKIELTRVHQNFEADTFFPEIDLSEWEVEKEEFHKKDNQHAHAFSYLTYVRK